MLAASGLGGVIEAKPRIQSIGLIRSFCGLDCLALAAGSGVLSIVGDRNYHLHRYAK